MAQVFISYSHEDKDFVVKLADDLRQHGVNLWFDEFIDQGRWDDRIEEELDACFFFLIVLSPTSVASQNVRDEISIAVDEKKVVIPILYQECKLPLRIRREQYTDFRGDYDQALAQLFQVLSTSSDDQPIPPPPTINMQEAINQFHNLMDPADPCRVLRMFGEGKTGKTHLATKVFPVLGRFKHRSRYAVLDLRNKTQDNADILYVACSWLGGKKAFPHYHQAYEEWLQRPQVDVEDLQALLQMGSTTEGADESRRMIRYLISQFMADLSDLADTPLLMIFDQLDDATPGMTTWLMNILIVQLAALPHVRVVVAGRIVPEAAREYAAVCQSCQLQPVTEETAYIEYCRQRKISLDERDIQLMAWRSDYKPGAFVDFIPIALGQEAARG